MADSASITGDQTGGQGYGKIGQVASPGPVSSSTDAAGNRTDLFPGGGRAVIPSSNPQTAQPDEFTASNGTATGIVGGAGNVPQVRQQDKSFAAARLDGPNPPSTTDPLLSSGSPAPTNPLTPSGPGATPDKLTASLGGSSLSAGKVASNGFSPGATPKSPNGTGDDEDEEEGTAKAFYPLQKPSFGG